MLVTTEVINNSDRELVLKEGNAGAYRRLATLEVSGPKCKFRIECNTDATSREFWVGTGVKDGDKSKITINSDDCVECETIYIKNDPRNPTKLILDTIKRGAVTELVNRTGGVATLKTRLKNGFEEIEIQSNEKVLLQPGPKEYSVTLADGKTIPITNKQVAKNQRVDISPASGSQQDAKLDMVTRGLYLTEVTNRSSGAIQVKHLKGSGGAATVLATLQTEGKYTIKYDPKKKDHKYSVECSSATAGSRPHILTLTSSDFADFMTIDVVDGKPGGMKELQRLRPRPSADKLKDGIVTRFLGWLETRLCICKKNP